MKKWMFSLVAVPILLFGCGKDPVVDTLDSGENIPVAIEVEIINELALPANTEVELAARVTQGGKFVEDADEVLFEVWASGKRDESIMLEGTLKEDGIYAAQHIFPQDDVYYMFAHTTARGMHMMPKIELVVGNPDQSKVLEDTSDFSMKKNHATH